MNPITQVSLIVSLVPLGLLALAVLIGSFVIVRSRRAQRAWAMQNQIYSGTPTSRRQLVLPNVTQFQTPGALGVIGQTEGSGGAQSGLPFVTLDSYQSVVTGATALFNGSFTLSVIGRLANSPLVTHQINPGDRLYLNGATFDSTTNIWYGGSIDANPAGIPIGVLDPSYTGNVGAGLTAQVPVLISTAGGM